MAKHIVKGYITSTQYSWETKPSFGFSMYKPLKEQTDTVIVSEHQFEVEVPDDFDPRPGKIAALKKKKKLMEAQFTASVKVINDQINSLLAIEM